MRIFDLNTSETLGSPRASCGSIIYSSTRAIVPACVNIPSVHTSAQSTYRPEPLHDHISSCGHEDPFLRLRNTTLTCFQRKSPPSGEVPYCRVSSFLGLVAIGRRRGSRIRERPSSSSNTDEITMHLLFPILKPIGQCPSVPLLCHCNNNLSVSHRSGFVIPSVISSH